MDSKPILTYSGDVPLFNSLKNQIAIAVGADTSEWKRSYGRSVIKNVRVEASFQPLDKSVLEKYKNGNWSILEFPALHIFISECNDVETYKSSVKDEIDTWLKTLQNYGISDWMILIVETIDVKKTKNILPRTTVLDKIRLDFASRNGDRCLSILNPLKFEMKATESFRCMVQRIRHLVLAAYNKNIVKYEELIRANREKRNQESWSFIKYFILQEQLAFVLEMLGLHTDALVQYDELDAMFSQFVLNSAFGEKPAWLKTFEKPINSFQGITLNKQEMIMRQKKIEDNTITLLEFRNYLFERQCVLLNKSAKQWEIAERLLPFLFSTLREIEALKLDSYLGALSCWEFVCCIEVLNLCDQVAESKDILKCSQYSAPIWDLAKDKLYELGKFCGLLPGFTPTSEQLHIVVQLSAAIGDPVPAEPEVFLDIPKENNPGNRSRSVSPNRKPKQSGSDRLKEALGSNNAFQKHYLELCELAISTYKHVARLRSARLVGRDLGNFYCSLNEPNKAVVFFTDLLRELKSENWHALSSQTLLELASCYKKMDDNLNYTKTCGAISCCNELEVLVRTFYFDEFLKSLKGVQELLQKDENKLQSITILEDHFRIVDIQLTSSNPVIQDSPITVEIKLESNFPREILCEKMAINFEMCDDKDSDLSGTQKEEGKLPFQIHLDYKQDNTLNCASVVCEKGKQPVRRTSSTRRKISATMRSDFTNSATTENRVIFPGINLIELNTKALRVGIWNFKQLSLEFMRLEFLSEMIPVKTVPFEITTKPSSAALHFQNLVAGLEQSVKLFVSGGSFHFPEDSKINLKCSKGLRMRISNSGEINEYKRELEVNLSKFKLFEERTIELDTFCELPCRRDETPIEHKVALQCPWSRSEIHIPIRFLPIFTASCRLHSSGSRKFLQVIIKSLFDQKLILSNAAMGCQAEGVVIRDLNPKSQQVIPIMKNVSVSYLWEIEVEPLKTENELPVISIEFNLFYAEADRPTIVRKYVCPFDVTDYKTLYQIQVKIEPSELCRVGSACHMNLKITKVQEDYKHNDLMYEVLVDQNSWAVCGRSAGVISMTDSNEINVTLDVFPLSPGFLRLPNIRLSKYVANKSKSEGPKLLPFAPTQVYNSTKSLQLHVLASNNNE